MIQPVQNGKIDCQAVILAGGLGTRMRPVTEAIPKPMISVRGKPFLSISLNFSGKMELNVYCCWFHILVSRSSNTSNTVTR